MMVPASEDVIIKSGVLFFVGVGRVLPEISGAVVSIVVLSVELELSSLEVVSSSEVVLVLSVVLVVVVVVVAASSLLQEMMVKLKRRRREMRMRSMFFT